MTLGSIVNLVQSGVLQVLKLAAPILGAALIIGLIVAIFQATTSIQEQTLTFLPKMIIILVVIGVFGSWMFTSMAQYTIHIFTMIPALAR